MSAVRALLDRHLRLLEAGDLDGLLGQYHADAVLLGFDRVHVGHDALGEHYAGQLAQRPRPVELLQYADCDDVASYQLVLEVGGEQLRTHGTLVLRGERIARHVVGLFPALSGGGARGRPAVTVDLEPYVPWVAHTVPDPRSAGREAIGPVLLELVAAEGPVLAERAYRLYVKASGGKALTSTARAPLSGAAHRLARAGAIELDDHHGAELLRAAGTSAVRVRELGPRTLDEVPLGELAELADRLCTAGADDLPRAVLDAYGLVRMTARAEQRLDAAIALLG